MFIEYLYENIISKQEIVTLAAKLSVLFGERYENVDVTKTSVIYFFNVFPYNFELGRELFLDNFEVSGVTRFYNKDGFIYKCPEYSDINYLCNYENTIILEFKSPDTVEIRKNVLITIDKNCHYIFYDKNGKKLKLPILDDAQPTLFTDEILLVRNKQVKKYALLDIVKCELLTDFNNDLTVGDVAYEILRKYFLKW